MSIFFSLCTIDNWASSFVLFCFHQLWTPTFSYSQCWIENLMILEVSLLFFLRVGCGRRKQQINHKLCSVLSVPEILINSTTELVPTSQLSWKSWASFMTAAALLFRRWHIHPYDNPHYQFRYCACDAEKFASVWESQILQLQKLILYILASRSTCQSLIL